MSGKHRHVESLFTPEERAAVEAAVEEAERGTSAEIVPMVAPASARHQRAPDMAAMLLAFLAVLGLAIVSPAHQVDGIQAVVAFLAAAAAGFLLTEKLPFLKRLFLSRLDLEEAAADGASRAFRTSGAGDGEGRTGVLIYVSLFERAVVVLADRAAARALEAEDYGAIRDAIVEGLRKRRPGEALLDGIRKAGDVLAAKLPRAPDDRQEVSSRLRILD